MVMAADARVAFFRKLRRETLLLAMALIISWLILSL
jgi:hypothetical protein